MTELSAPILERGSRRLWRVGELRPGDASVVRRGPRPDRRGRRRPSTPSRVPLLGRGISAPWGSGATYIFCAGDADGATPFFDRSDRVMEPQGGASRRRVYQFQIAEERPPCR